MYIDFDLYKVFCEVVKYKSISKAADSMFVSQSAITQSIKKLENLLGGKLFFRNKYGVELTDEGKKLYEYIVDSIETVSNASNIFSNYINLETGKVRIGGGDSLLLNIIFPVLIDFVKDYPDIDIDIITEDTDKLLKDLAHGEIDIVVLNTTFTSNPYLTVELVPLLEPTYCLWASKKYLKLHPYNGINDLNNHALVLPKPPTVRRKIFDDYCQKNNIQLHQDYEVSSYYIADGFVSNDIGIGFNRLENVKKNHNQKDYEILQEFKVDNNKDGIAVLKDAKSNRATLELIKRIKKYYLIS